MLLSKKVLVGGVAIAALAAPALAEDRSTEKQKEQYLYQQSQEQGLNSDPGAIGKTRATSGPGVQGAPDTRTGPATRAPGGSAEAPNSGNASSGASSGDTGMGDPGVLNNNRRTTQPSQDSSGVQGFPDTRTGPSTRSPEDGTQGAGQGAGSSQ